MDHRHVVDRVVVPVQRRAQRTAGEGDRLGGGDRRRADRPPAPEQVDAPVEQRAEGDDVLLVAVAVVHGRADDERARAGTEHVGDMVGDVGVRLRQRSVGVDVGRVLKVLEGCRRRAGRRDRRRRRRARAPCRRAAGGRRRSSTASTVPARRRPSPSRRRRGSGRPSRAAVRSGSSACGSRQRSRRNGSSFGAYRKVLKRWAARKSIMSSRCSSDHGVP